MLVQTVNSAVDIRNLTLGYGSTNVVFDFCLSVYQGEIHALAGENGAGKTTVLKAIRGLITQTSGEIAVSRASKADVHRIGFVLQHDVLPSNMTVASCVQCAASATQQRLESDAVEQYLDRVGLSLRPHVRTSQLTMHQRQLLQLACALSSKPTVLLLDEPTAVMSKPDSDRFWELIKSEVNSGLTVIIATHKLEDIIAHCSHVTVMRTGRHVFTRRAHEVTVQDIIVGMAPETVGVSNCSGGEKKRLGHRPVVHISDTDSVLMLHPHEIHGIAGLDGSGYDRWLTSVALTKQEGINVTINGINIERTTVAQRRAIGIAYIPSDRHADAVIVTDSLVSNTSYGSSPNSLAQLVRPISLQMQQVAATAIVDRYDVRPPVVSAGMDTLSGGNQQKFVIGRELERKSQILVLNQPTRGLDRYASAEVSRKLRLASHRDQAAILVYSDDLSFLLSTCDTISTFSNGCLTQTRPVSEWSESMLVEAIV
ncbi:MAG: ATP-binding cassette domain-containing protein [Armatimonadota bacterium]